MSLVLCLLPPLAEVILLAAGAFFASTETAYTSLSRITVRQMLKNNEKHAKEVSALRSKLDRLISTVLVGTNFIITFSSSLATAYAVRVFGPSSVSYATAIVSVLVIIFSEIIPKTYAAVRPVQVAQGSAVPLIAIQKVLFPIVRLSDHLSAFIEWVERGLFRHSTPLITEEELRTLIAVGENEGTLDEGEKIMLDRLFDFAGIQVRDIMKHRSLTKYVNVHDTLEEVVRIFNSGFSRLPVYEDTPENIIGVLHYKAVLFAGKGITQSRDFVRICMRAAMFVPETLSAAELLQRFKKEKDNFAVVINEYGSMAGIVTMDDILREVFGHVTDEYGMSEVAPEKRVTVVSTNEFIIPGDMRLDDFNDIMKMNLDSESFDTLGGWLLERFGELPSTGAAYRGNGAVFIVEDQSARRIQSVRVKLAAQK